MKIRILAMGTKMPAWVQQGFAEYRKRLPAEFAVELQELELAKRTKTTSTDTVINTESEKLLGAVPAGFHLLALDKGGQAWSTEKLAERLADWQMQGQSVAMLIGGPDGLSAALKARADTVWSLSELTLPHPLVRVVLIEQLYRAWCVLHNHPYHK